MKIEPLSLSISLVAIGIALTNFRNDRLAVLFVALGVLAFPVARYLERRQAAAQKEKRLENLRRLNELREKSGPVSLAFIRASNDEEVAAAEGLYKKWQQECVDALTPIVGEGEATAFILFGVLPAVSIIISRPGKSDYRWREKEKYLQRLDIYRDRLAALMKKVG